MSESFSAICEWRESSADNPSREPAFCSFEALESLDGFESSVQLFVVAFDEIRGSRTAVVEELLCFNVPREEIAVVEDIVERRDLQRVIVVAWSSPTDVTLQIRLPEVRKIEDFFFEICQEASVGLFASHFERSSDVLEEVYVTELNDDAGVDLFRSQTDGFVVVADERLQVVAGIFELREELEHRLEILGWGEQADRDIVRQVIDAVDEGNLPVVSLHCHIFPVHDEEAAEALGVAVGERDLVVVGQCIQFGHERSVGRINALADEGRKRASARAFEMQRQQRFCFAAMIDAETFAAIVTEMSFQTVP